MTTSGPNPGSGPENLGLADVVVFFGWFGWVNINFDGFPQVFDSPWPQLSQNAFSIVQLMLAYEARARARARAPRTGTSAAQLGTHSGIRKGQKTRKPIKDDFRHGSLCRLAMF